MPGFDHGIKAGHAPVDHFNREIDQQDRVLGHDPHQHQNADQHGHGNRTAGNNQSRRHPTNRQGQREQDGERLDHRFEQQDQHAQHQKQPQQHGIGKAGEQFGLNFSVAGFCGVNGCRQIDRRDAFFRVAIHDLVEPCAGVTQRDAGWQVRANGGHAFAVQAVHHAGPFGDHDIRHSVQWHTGPGCRGDPQSGNAVQVIACSFGQLHAHRDQPVIDRQFGQSGAEIANGGHAQRLGNCRGGHAKAGRFFGAGSDLQLGPGQSALGRDTLQQRIAAQRLFQPGDGDVQIGFAVGQNGIGDVAPGPTRPVNGAGDAGVRDRGDKRLQFNLDIRLRANTPMRGHIGQQIAQNRRRLGDIQQFAFQRVVQPVQHHCDRRTPHIAAPCGRRAAQNEHVLHAVHIFDRGINLIGDRPGFGQSHPRRQFNRQGDTAGILGRDERAGDLQHEIQRHRQNAKGGQQGQIPQFHRDRDKAQIAAHDEPITLFMFVRILGPHQVGGHQRGDQTGDQ